MFTDTYFWLAAFVIFGIVEAATVGLTSIWFALGALMALVAAAVGAQLWLQIVVFIVVSALALAFTRPLARKCLKGRRVATNTDRVLGQEAKVTEVIDNIAGTGAVYVDGKTWTARSKNGTPIPSGTLVIVQAVEGVKLMVDPVSQPVSKSQN